MQSEKIVINYFYIDTDKAKPIIKAEPWKYAEKLSKECIIYKISRSVLKHDIDNDEIKKNLNHTGIYFLLGKDKDTFKTNIYVGQAGLRKDRTGLLRRIKEHDNKKEAFWDECVIFTTSDNSLDKSDICYLEDKFTKLVRKIPNNIVQNSADTNDGNINDEKKTYFERYIQFILIVMDILGYKVFKEEENQNITIEENALLSNNNINNQAAIKKDNNTINIETNNDDSWIFYFKRNNLSASAKWTNDGFVVLKGSEISTTLTPTAQKTTKIIDLRQKYQNRIDCNHKLIDDILFTSPSTAASFVGGHTLNGNEVWKTRNNKSPQDIKDVLLKNPISIPIFNDETKLEENENCIFKFVGIKTINAKARWNNKEFIVLKGSEIRRNLTPSAEKDIRIKQLREKYKNEINENCILLNDIAFKSKSTAAEFVGGSAFNGNTAWIATNENYIQEIKNNELIQNTNDDEIIFLNFIRQDLHARCKRTNEGYWVLKDSQIKDKLTNSALENETILNLRQKYKDKIDLNWKLKDDCFFKSSSAAAKFVAGGSYDGKIVWISDDGKLLEDIIKEKGWNK